MHLKKINIEKYIKILLVIILNNLLVGMLLGYIWYKFGFAKYIDSGFMSLVCNPIVMSFTKYEFIYYIILFIIEFISINLLRKYFSGKKEYIIYLVITFLISFLFWLYMGIGFGIGVENGECIVREIDIFEACIGMRYNSKIFIYNIPTIISLISVYFQNKSTKN